MKQGFFWEPSESQDDDRRYVTVDGREAIAKGINPYPEIIEWLSARGVGQEHYTTFPMWNGKSTLGFYFDEPVSLETVMVFKLTWG